MTILYLKAFHIIFMVTWFAGLFYIVRLFIYAAEAKDKPEPESSILIKQYKLMMQRLWYIITWPGAVLTVVFGVWMLIENPGYLSGLWMHLKLGFVICLLLYHLWCQKIYNSIQKDQKFWNSTQLRIWNEVATLLLFIIVFLVVLKQELSALAGVVGFMVLAILLLMGIKFYKKKRAAKEARLNEKEEDATEG